MNAYQTDRALQELRDAVDSMREIQGGGRSVSIAINHAETALLWLKHAAAEAGL